jgi:hypothetical protein
MIYTLVQYTLLREERWQGDETTRVRVGVKNSTHEQLHVPVQEINESQGRSIIDTSACRMYSTGLASSRRLPVVDRLRRKQLRACLTRHHQDPPLKRYSYLPQNLSFQRSNNTTAPRVSKKFRRAVVKNSKRYVDESGI